jgi:hypothetical protein
MEFRGGVSVAMSRVTTLSGVIFHSNLLLVQIQRVRADSRECKGVYIMSE